MDDVTRAMSKGGACECPRGGCFPIFRRADDVKRTMSKAGGGVPVNVQECRGPRSIKSDSIVYS